MQTNTGETVSKEVMEKLLLRNLELLKKVEELVKLLAALEGGEQDGNQS